jgi:hypothetical protein
LCVESNDDLIFLESGYIWIQYLSDGSVLRQRHIDCKYLDLNFHFLLGEKKPAKVAGFLDILQNNFKQ